MSAATRLAPAALAAILLALAWSYSYRIATNPFKWEEPRRALVAMEMMHSGNYVTPRLVGEPYLKKPPLQNWLIAATSGLDPARVGALAVRAISVLAVAGCCLILWSLGTDGLHPRPNALPAVIFATTGTVIQHGRAGEIDMLLCFLVLAAFAFHETGRRGARPGVQWVMPQVVLAAGVLTKWIAPLFFYPPVLWLAWRDRRTTRLRPGLLSAGAVLLLLLVAGWLVPFTLSNPASGLEQRWWSEITTRTTGRGAGELATHVLTYPVLVLSALLPWSLWVLTIPVARWRATIGRLGSDPWIALSAAIVGWTALVFLFVPEQKARYLMPAFPFAAVLLARLIEEGTSWFSLRRTPLQRAARHLLPWLVAIAAWIVLATYLASDQLEADDDRWTAALAGAAVLAAAAWWFARMRKDLPAAPLLVLGVLYAVVHAGLLELREAERHAGFPRTAEVFAKAIHDDRPVVIDRRVSLKVCQPLTRELDRPLARKARPKQSAWWIAPEKVASTETAVLPPHAPILHGDLALRDLPAPEGWSLLSRPLYPPTLEALTRAERERELESARAKHEAYPADIEAIVWWGRRTAYLGRYREAIEIFSAGLALAGDEPHLLRHRGHRYLSLRELERAIADFRDAAWLVRGQADEVEPDGLPNERGIPTSTLQTNIWYHLGLAHYVRGELREAEDCYRRCVALSRNDDMLAAASHWLYTTLRRQGDDDAAEEVLKPFRPGMDIIENHAYYELLLLYRGERTPEQLLAWAEAAGDTGFASAAYGLANWHLVEGRREAATKLLERIVERGATWPTFGHLAAEADLVRIWDRAL